MYAQSLSGSDDIDDELHLYRKVERCVLLLTRLRDQMDEGAFLRRARDMVGKGLGDSPSGRRRPFQIAYILQALCTADCLRNVSSMKTVLQKALEMVMPEVLRPAFHILMAESEAAIPHHQPFLVGVCYWMGP